MTTLPPLLFLTPDPLTALWQDKPQIARRVARVYPVLYAGEEPYLRPLLHDLRHGRVRLADLHPPALTQVADGLYHFHWSLLAPVTGAPLLGPLTAALRRRRLQSALHRLTQAGDRLSVIGNQLPDTAHRPPSTVHRSPITAHPSPILWLFRPGMAHWIDALHPKLVIYHVVDEYSAYPNLTPAQAERQRQLDRELTARADLVFCTAQSLVDARLPLNPHTYYLPNAVDYEAFQAALASARGLDTAPTPTRPTGAGLDTAQTPTRPTGAGLDTTPTPTRPTSQFTSLPIYRSPLLGVVGGINAKVDLALLAAVAERRPDWTLLLVGPLGYGLDSAEVERLRALPNVHLPGPVPPEQVPAVIAACDVCLIPYKLTEQTRHVNPLKVYEYLACGKPVVATALPELRQFGEVVRVAEVVEGDKETSRQVDKGTGRQVDKDAGRQGQGSEWTEGVGTDVESFVACVEAALAEAGDPARIAARQTVAAANTWDHRVARMLALIEEALARR